MGNSKHLGLMLLAPAGIFVFLFFLAPVFLTGVFGFTNMSTATGIKGGAYVITESSMLSMTGQYGEDELADQLLKKVYTIDEAGLAAALEAGGDAAAIKEFESKFLGEIFDSRRDVERAIKSLNARPSSTRAVKVISANFERSVVNIRYETEEELLAAIAGFGISLTDVYGGRNRRVLSLYLAFAQNYAPGALCSDVEMAGVGLWFPLRYS
jgi:inositol-phosphate transport system permease protein